ncbi:matrix protein [Strawberry virus 2]|nr:matrix protein [Strawberry virus 2]
MNPMSWYRLSFKESFWRFDAVESDGSATICSVKSKELFSSGLKEIFPKDPELVEILSKMEEKNEIHKLNLTADSDMLGIGVSRCEFLFPKEVFIPSSHKLSSGIKEATLDNRVVTIHNKVYITCGHLKIGISQLTADMKKIMYINSPKSFIGCMDGNPFGIPSKSTKGT